MKGVILHETYLICLMGKRSKFRKHWNGNDYKGSRNQIKKRKTEV